MQAALPAMREQKWGRILMVTSISAREPINALTVSNGLRAGLIGLANSVSREVAADGITVNALLPGYTKTERLAELGIPDEELSKDIPAKRLGKPEEVAETIAFFASDRCGFITGHVVFADFRGELFPGSAALLALADEMREVRTICHCGKKATMVVRMGGDGKALKEGPQVQVGGNETYVSLCRRHWREAVGDS